MLWTAVWLLVAAAHAVPQIKSDEHVVFYPTYATVNQDQRVTVRFHGMVLEAELNSVRRAAMVSTLRRSLGIASDSDDAARMEQRVRPFLMDGEGGKKLNVRLDDLTFPVGPTTRAGRFRFTQELDERASWILVDVGRAGQWLDVAAELPAADRRSFTGRIQWIAPTGVSVISDIDDTIKVTNVSDRSEMLANTLLRPFVAVQKMAELYRQAADDQVVFHYVSNSPWELYGPLSDFLEESQFPRGTVHLRAITIWQLISGQGGDGKRARIDQIMDDFPGRRFVLIGDSGQEDPEIYGEVARQRPEQVIRILIRDVAARPLDAPRRTRAFRGLDPSRYLVFTDARSIDRVTR